MIPRRLIRSIGLWWFCFKQRSRLDMEARERRNAISHAQRSHRRVKPLYEAQKAGMTAKLMKEMQNG
ncbi:hypothetical protein [Pelagibacterium lentulum]|uniref:Uncharacterized protein n=1 Tax=Pelagibacterium lentulum TaxID=2029865 RepID=A0A916VW91_9HYPH|nr:hypothetical protein [Pelagibacterium lentulum]GGA45865.1 hypothetical protein GCM10011499_14510 [Pelagibacterium lentulum]